MELKGAVLKVIAASENSRVYLHRGARLRRCDWSLDYADGINLRLPYLSKARELARLTALHARHAFAQGHWQAGVEDAADLMTLARHVACRDDAGTGPTLLALLVGYAIDGVAIETLAADLPRLDAPALKALSARLEALPARVSVADSVRAENKVIVGWLRTQMQQAEKAKPGSWRDVFAFAAADEPNGQKYLQALASYEKALAFLKDLEQRYDQLARLTALPKAEFDVQYPAFATEAKANPLVNMLLPATANVRSTEDRNQVQLALLKAAIAVVRDGPEKVKDHKDPFGTGPFTYRALDQGFELRSQLTRHGQPVVLIFGQRPK